MNHDLYKTGDPDAPDAIKDRNGEVVLRLCRVCGRGEAELVGMIECADNAARRAPQTPQPSRALRDLEESR